MTWLLIIILCLVFPEVVMALAMMAFFIVVPVTLIGVVLGVFYYLIYCH